VGGNPELVESGVTGTLVPRSDAARMAQAIRAFAESPELCRRHGLEARRTAERRFGMDAMVNGYLAIYDGLLAGARRPVRVASGD
jgi:glycosyltransferase involved in cell wall biosynthesis